MIAKHVFSENEALVTDNQWPYRKGRSTKLLLIHLTETWRRAIDNKLVVGAVFIDFRKAFDCLSHSILLHKLEHNFGITGNLLVLLRDYLSEREQYSVINGVPSEKYQSCTRYTRGLRTRAHTLRLVHKQSTESSKTLQRRSCMLMILPCTVLVNP